MKGVLSSEKETRRNHVYRFMSLMGMVRFVLGVVVYAAIIRAVVHPKDRPFFSLRLSMDEVRVFAPNHRVDLSRFTLLPFGGAGAVHAGALAEELGTPHVFTLDLRGFRAYRWKSRRSFQIFPSA